jgi:hypothetical protein
MLMEGADDVVGWVQADEASTSRRATEPIRT